MKRHSFSGSVLLSVISAAVLGACGGDDYNGKVAQAKAVVMFDSTVLISDGSVPALATSANPKSGWGIAFGPSGTAWVADNGQPRSLQFDGAGTGQASSIALPAGANGPANPTGIVFNPTARFVVTARGQSSSAVLLFATDAGTIAGWSPDLLPTDAVTGFDDVAGGAIYKGLTLVQHDGKDSLYATDFRNGKVDVFDASFTKQAQGSGAFIDPALPPGFAPFGIQSVGDRVIVTFAMQDETGAAQVDGPGLGFVDVFDNAGKLISRLSGSTSGFNAPWGIAKAPADFGAASNALLIGNAGDGTIDVFDGTTLAYQGMLELSDGTVFTQPGLRGIHFGNDAHRQPHDTLFYVTRPNGMAGGVFGRIDAVPARQVAKAS